MKTIAASLVLLLLLQFATPGNACPPVALSAHCAAVQVESFAAAPTVEFAQSAFTIQAVPFAILVQEDHCAAVRVNAFAVRERRFRLRDLVGRDVFRQSVVIRSRSMRVQTRDEGF